MKDELGVGYTASIYVIEAMNARITSLDYLVRFHCSYSYYVWIVRVGDIIYLSENKFNCQFSCKMWYDIREITSHGIVNCN